MASMVGNPTGSVGEPGGVRAMAVAKAAGVGKGGFGPEPGNTSRKELQGKVEQRNRNLAEARQDQKEASGPYRVGSSRPRPIPPARPRGPGNKQARSPYGSNRNYPQNV